MTMRRQKNYLDLLLESIKKRRIKVKEKDAQEVIKQAETGARR